jgi:ComF family protein
LAGVEVTMEFHRTELHRTSSGQLIDVTMVGIVRFDENARNLVTNLKYQHRKSLAFTLAAEIADNVHQLPMPDLVTWIPTTDEHRLSRGFDHAELIARHVGALLSCRTQRLLRRTSKGHQTGQSRETRLNAVHFSASPRCRRRHVWVIDDVWTTGSTFHAATDALTTMGAASVACVAYAHVPQKADGLWA